MSSVLAVLKASRGVVLLAVLGFLSVGCVPYSIHQLTKEELVKAKDANADLIKKYNSAVQELMRMRQGGGEGGVVPADYKALQDEVARLRAEAARRVKPGFTPEDKDRLGPDVTLDDHGLAIGDSLLFAEGSADLRREAYPTLDKIVSLLMREHPSEPIIIEGHTDDKPVVKTAKIYGDNVTLGYARAHAVYLYFKEKGIPLGRMTIHTYAENKPVSSPDTVSSIDGRRQQNRRVVVRLGPATI